MKATLIKSNLPKFTGDARLYRVDPPLGGYTHVIVSATVVQFSGPETCIFGADLDEEDVVDWGELAGSFRGGLDHKYALQLAGYEVVEEQQT